MALPGKTDIKVTATDALEFEPVAPEPRKRRWGLKLFVLLVLAAVGSWGWLIYGHEIRAVLAGGEPGVPLIKAAMGPVKVRPENPGGLEVPDRDKLVYDRIGGRPEGEGEPRGPERLLPPPEQPLPKPGPVAALTPAAPAAEPAPDPPTESVRAPAKAEATAAKRQPTSKTKPVPTVPTVKDVKTAERPLPPPPPAAPPTSNPTPSPVLSAARSNSKPADEPTPPTAPAKAEPVKPEPAAPAAAPTQTVGVAPAPKPAAPSPAPVPTGRSFLVQLAAARSPQGARDEWDRLRTKHQDLLGSLGLRVTKADLGPTRGVFYRLRAGPLTDEAAARDLCQQLAKRQVGCLIIKPQP